MKLIKDRKKAQSYLEFLYILPFYTIGRRFHTIPSMVGYMHFLIINTPFPLTMDKFVGFKWFISMVDNSIKVNQLLKGS